MHGFHSGMIISEEMEALMYGIRGYSDDDICESMMPLMYAMHDTLERYNATDPVTSSTAATSSSCSTQAVSRLATGFNAEHGVNKFLR